MTKKELYERMEHDINKDMNMKIDKNFVTLMFSSPYLYRLCFNALTRLYINNNSTLYNEILRAYYEEEEGKDEN